MYGRRDRRAADREAAVKAAGAATEELSEEENMLTAIGADEASNVTNEPAQLQKLWLKLGSTPMLFLWNQRMLF